MASPTYDETAAAILARVEAGHLSPAVALMELLIATEDVAVTASILRVRAPSPSAARVLRLLEEQAAGAHRVASMLRSDMDRPPVNASVEEGIAFCRRLFDWSVAQSEEASVALYSLGDANLLAAATDEIVRWLDGQAVLGRERDALDLGCGIGRLAVPLAPRLRALVGIDVSSEMVSRARRRCAELSNVRVSLASGADLKEFADASFDLVLAVDVFPYLVQSALSLAGTHVQEAARVLRPAGDLVILNFSYRGDREEDAQDIARFADQAGLAVVVPGMSPFEVWDGLAFRLRKPA